MSPIAREEIYGGQPNVSDAVVAVFCLCMFAFLIGHGMAYEVANKPRVEARK